MCVLTVCTPFDIKGQASENKRFSPVYFFIRSSVHGSVSFEPSIANNLSPLKTLSRGYSLVLDQNNNLIKSYSQVLIGNDLSVLLSEGELSVTVTDVLEKSDRLINR